MLHRWPNQLLGRGVTPVSPRVPPVLIDVALAILVTVAVALAISAKVEPEALEPDVWAYLFAVALGALMLVRRRWPAGVLIATVVLLFAYYTIGYPAVGVVGADRRRRVLGGRTGPAAAGDRRVGRPCWWSSTVVPAERGAGRQGCSASRGRRTWSCWSR